MKDLQAIYQVCLQEVKDAGLEPGNIVRVFVNNRLKSTWGRCGYVDGDKTRYRIEINPILVQDDTDDLSLKGTIVHEILHSLNKCMNHGEMWKQKAAIINRTYPQYNIKRTTSSAEKGISVDQKAFKYVIQCNHCKKQYGYYKRGRVINNLSRCHCKCGGSLTLIKSI